MPEFRGTALVVEVIHSGGTITMQDQYRSIKIPFSRDAVDSSAGTGDPREFLPGLTQFTVSYEGLHNGTATPMGTADIKTLRSITNGTVRISEFGTATGQHRYLAPGFITKVDADVKYDDVATCNWEWQGSGALTEGVW